MRRHLGATRAAVLVIGFLLCFSLPGSGQEVGDSCFELTVVEPSWKPTAADPNPTYPLPDTLVFFSGSSKRFRLQPHPDDEPTLGNSRVVPVDGAPGQYRYSGWDATSDSLEIVWSTGYEVVVASLERHSDAPDVWLGQTRRYNDVRFDPEPGEWVYTVRVTRTPCAA